MNKKVFSFVSFQFHGIDNILTETLDFYTSNNMELTELNYSLISVGSLTEIGTIGMEVFFRVHMIVLCENICNIMDISRVGGLNCEGEEIDDFLKVEVK